MLFILLLVVSFLSIFLKTNNKKHDFAISISIILISSLVVLFRDTCAHDYQNYINYYTSMNSIQNLISGFMEIGYSFLNLIFNSLNVEYSLFLFVLTFISLSIKMYAFDKLDSKNKYFYYFIYLTTLFLTFENAQIRSGFAFSFVLLALVYYKNIFKFTLLIIVGSLFHISTLFILGLPMFISLIDYINKFKYKNIILILLLFVILNINIIDILLFINNNFINSMHLNAKLIEYATSGASIISMSFLIRVLIIVMIYYIFNHEIREGNSKIYFEIIIYSLVIYLLFLDIPVISSRVGSYLRFFESFFLLKALLYVCNKKVNMKLLPYYIFILTMVSYYLYVFAGYALSSTYIECVIKL